MPSSPSLKRSGAISVLLLLGAGGCASEITAADTVDLGDNFEPPDFAINEDFFHCVIQPKVLSEFKCAKGGAGDGDGCHTARSALRLVEVTETARCTDGRVVGAPPADSVVNLERVRTTVAGDSESSPFYRRPIGKDSHPRVIFKEDSEAAALIRRWIDQGGS